MAITTDAVDEDVKAGAKAAWAGWSETLAAVPTESFFTGDVPAGIAAPYIQTDCVSGGEREWMQGNSDYLDHRKLTVKVWGLESQVKAIGQLAVAALGSPAGFLIANSRCMHSLTGDERLVQEEVRLDGNQLWRIEIDFHLLLARTMPTTADLSVVT